MLKMKLASQVVAGEQIDCWGLWKTIREVGNYRRSIVVQFEEGGGIHLPPEMQIRTRPTPALSGLRAEVDLEIQQKAVRALDQFEQWLKG